MKDYRRSDVTIVSASAEPEGGTRIVYRPVLDSLYYCPGVRWSHEQSVWKVWFVRCGIKDRCSVDAKAERGDHGQWSVRVPASAVNVTLVFSDGELPLLRDGR